MGYLYMAFTVAASVASAAGTIWMMSRTPTLDLEAIGEMTTAQVFNGAAQEHDVCTILAAQLEQDGKYVFNQAGLLVIKGDVPEGVRITANNGKIYIDGNVGEGAEIDASIPEDSHTDTTLIPISTGKVTTLIPITDTVFDGFTYAEDVDPAVIITGSVADDAEISSNHGIHIGDGFSLGAEFDSTRDSKFSKVTTGEFDNHFVAPVIERGALAA